MFFVAMSTYKGFPTANASKNIASSQKKLGGNDGKDIHAIVVVVSSDGLNIRYHLKVLIEYIQFYCDI